MNKTRVTDFYSLGRMTGPYKTCIVFILLSLVLLTLSRIGLGIWQFDRLHAEINWSTYLLQGIRVDLIIIGLWLVVPLLLAPVWAREAYFFSWMRFTYLWSLAGLITLVFMELVTTGFILQYDIRPNRLFIEYLKYPREVFSTLWNGFRFVLIGGILATCLLSFFAALLLKKSQHDMVSCSNKMLWFSWPVLLLLVFGVIRSSTAHRPANPALFALTGDAMINSLIINSSYSVLYALYSLKHEAHSSEIYGKLAQRDVITQALDWPWLKQYKFSHTKYPTLHQQRSNMKRARPLNLVIILEESLGATFVESLGGLSVTPELEKLKEEGWWFEQLYATGTRSVRGIEAVVSGFMPTPAQSVVKLSLAQHQFFTLAGALKKQGFHTQFIYGGEAHFDNMRSFFTGNDFESVVDVNNIKDPIFVGSWGASDEDLFNTAHKQLLQLHQQSQPFFSLIFTSSNHTPFEFPDGRIELHEQPKQTVNNAVKYTDYALGKFIIQAKASSYWDDTLFLIVADHDARVHGNTLVPIKNFHIPGLIIGADIQAKKITPVASQIDLGPTILSLMGISCTHPMVGRDFTLDSKSPGRAMMQFDQYYALMEEASVTILKPDGSALAGTYDFFSKQMTINNEKVNKARAKKVLANVLLPSLLYREQLYPNMADIPRSVIPVAAK